ncbi:MAG: hypothetical protein A6F70_04140 [Cycloclasticus sp. symbiont of Bathymodiolus heckerae]|nr:MAG: hypothetical protein A6F70_04140 [Cycloclasticus sp. symbiont of Bathymodiolus heckerae]
MNTSSSTQLPAGIFTVIASLILITPLCGFLFDCGCTWPWEGLESHCNIHDIKAVHQCPWCVSTLAGVASVGLAVLIGFLVSIKPANLGYDVRDSALAGIQETSGPGFVKRVFVGLLSFTVVAVVTGWLSGYLQEYPYFVFVSAWSV